MVDACNVPGCQRPADLQYDVDKDGKKRRICSPCFGGNSALALDLLLGVRQADYGLQQQEADAAFERIDS